MTIRITNQVIAGSGIAFGTSGARGLVAQFTPDTCAAFALAFLDSLQAHYRVGQLAIAIDNRPSSLVMAQACAAALQAQGIEVIYYGVVPTPALAYQAMQDGMPCIMVTGSHIPFDRNGLKFYTPDGEISKADELAIVSAHVAFAPITELPELPVNLLAAENYIMRYTSLFDRPWLTGKRIGIYEHSSAGRDLYAKLFEHLGAEVVSLGRSDEFVPIDTEAVSEEDKQQAREWSAQYNLDCLFSTDGDGDRPLIADEHGDYLRGDILGLLTADELNINALAVPVSCNTAIESCSRFTKVERTRIGSPYVIAAFDALAQDYSVIAGFEANGGFLLGSDVMVNSKPLKALPTRDAVLPAIMLLVGAECCGISTMVAALPERYTYSDRIKNFSTKISRALLARGVEAPTELLEKLGIQGEITYVDQTDGLRMMLSNGDIIHLRPSGNAPELRCYVESKCASHAFELVRLVLAQLQNIEI
ncbi:phosphomannomutase [Vibrio sp. SM6]|uniref:Phosphomannomutase n=1 Tax=Vibrio agarilyticus TaxID=2726741 RepID=A0A7X8YHA1_9VIBR|nr:phosphomannomutase [Vibrio agarilyticus]NLS13524.1 phosphomannomutase [Vibrio agarilyticus]